MKDTASGSHPSPGEAADSPTSPRQVPHVTKNDLNATVGPNEGANSPPVAASPANASGTDRVDVAEQDRAIDAESMYDGRPSQDKNYSASREVERSEKEESKS